MPKYKHVVEKIILELYIFIQVTFVLQATSSVSVAVKCVFLLFAIASSALIRSLRYDISLKLTLRSLD